MKELTVAEHDEKVLGATKLILLDFWREGCGPCSALKEELKIISEEIDDIEIFTVDAGQEEELTQKYRVMATPTLLFVKDGAVKKKVLGYKSKDHIIEIIESLR